jgi:acetylornithine deacetylase/succinyl-diaminopimelate desuccinylase-like protein
VVPVNPATINQWTYPPFSGHVEDGWIYGRGGGDDKSGLIGIMLVKSSLPIGTYRKGGLISCPVAYRSALELLIESGFKPSRSLVISFGFDEETGGNIVSPLPSVPGYRALIDSFCTDLQAARALNKHITAKYGPDSMFMLGKACYARTSQATI